MSTDLQKKLAKELVNNLKSKKPKNKKDLLVSVGYDITTAETKPGEIIGQKGVQEELELLGFTEINAKKVVSKLMLDESQEGNVRLKAADMTFKVHGSYAPEKSITLNANANYNLTEDQVKKINEIALDEE